jgi:hypothetical protein
MNLEKMIPGMSGDFILDLASPTSPLSHKVHENALRNPQLVHVHKMCLREFAEKDSSRRRSNSGTPNPPPIQQRPASVGGSSNNSRPTSRMSSKESSACGEFGSCCDGLRPLSRGEAVRPVSRSEFRERNRTATDWFRATQSINSSSRSMEETEAMLAAARDRRMHGRPTVIRSRSVSKTGVVNLMEDAIVTEPPDRCHTAPTQTRKILDPCALWGSKPPAPIAKEKPKTVPVEVVRRRSGVAVGLEGDSLRARLAARHSH